MTRPAHPGRGTVGAFGPDALTAADASAELALNEECSLGSFATTQADTPPYGTVRTFTPESVGIPCQVQPTDDRDIPVVDDASRVAEFDLRVPHGTALAADTAVEITAGRNAGMRLRVAEVHDSSTEPLLRATCERITPGDG